MQTIRFTAGVALVLLAVTACGQSDQPGASGTSTTAQSTQSTPPPTASETSVPVPTASTPQPNPPTTKPGIAPVGTVSMGPSGPVVPNGFTQLPPEKVDSKGLPESYTERRVWLAPDGRSVQMFAVAPDACTGAEARVLETTSGYVRIAMNPMAVPQGGPEGQACATVLTPRPVSAYLGEPLGNRQVVLVDGG